MTFTHSSWRALFGLAGSQSIRVLQYAWPALLVLIFFELMIGVSIQWARASLFHSSRSEGYFLFYGILESMTVYALSTLWLIIVVTRIKEAPLQAENSAHRTPAFLSVGVYLKQVVIEDIRRFAGLIFYLTLLIVPGFIHWVRWMFVPFIVIDSRDYEEGRLDALKGSSQLARGHFFRCLFVLILSLLIAELAPSLLWPDTSTPLLQYSAQAAAVALLALPLHLYSISLLYCFFLELKKEKRLHG